MKRNIRALSMALALLMLALVLPHAALAATKPAELRVAQWRQNQSSLIIYTTAMGQNGYVADELSYDPNGYYVQLDDGYDLKITGVQAFSSTGESVHYILCCDISKSISSEQFEIERAALSSFGKSLDAKDHVSLITFGDTATTEASYVSGADLSNYVAKVDYLDSNTHLYEALNMAVDLTNSNSRTERCVLIVITDGDDDPGDTESLVSYQDINKTLSERQVPLYIISLNTKYTNVANPSMLARTSGGTTFDAGSNNAITDCLNKVRTLTQRGPVVTAQLVQDGTYTGVQQNELLVIMDAYSALYSQDDYNITVRWNQAEATPGPTQTPAPTPTRDTMVDKLEVDAVTEDSTSITVRTEGDALVEITYRGEKICETGEASRSGVFTWNRPEGDDSVYFTQGDPITVKVTDSAGNVDQKEITVGASSRRDIELNVQGMGEDAFVYGDTLTVSGRAQGNTPVRVKWEPSDGSEPYIDSASTQSNGGYKFQISGGSGDGQAAFGQGTLTVEYADNLGVSKSNYADLTWEQNAPVEADEDVAFELYTTVSEDTEVIEGKTDPGSTVQVSIGSNRLEPVVADEGDGSFSVPLEGVELRKGDPVTVKVTDPANNSYTLTPKPQVAASNRAKITVEVVGQDEETGVVNKETITVKGEAERGMNLFVTWFNDETGESTTNEVAVGSSGRYVTEFSKDVAASGRGHAEAVYADGRGASQAGGTDDVMWDSSTPAPTSTPTPVPTASPTPTVSPTPSPTATMPPATPTPSPEPTEKPFNLVEEYKDWLGDTDELLKNSHFWISVGAALLLIALIVLIVLLIIRGAKKKKRNLEFESDEPSVRENSELEVGRGTVLDGRGGADVGGQADIGTVRMGVNENYGGGAPVGDGHTVRIDTQANSGYEDSTEIGTVRRDPVEASGYGAEGPAFNMPVSDAQSGYNPDDPNGTVRVDGPSDGPAFSGYAPQPGYNADDPDGTVRVDAPADGPAFSGYAPQPFASDPGFGPSGFDASNLSAGTGTVRLEDEDEGLFAAGSGTIRLEEETGVTIFLHEVCKRENIENQRTLHLESEAIIGRNVDCDLVLKDQAVSGHHLKLTLENGALFATDLNSRNFTRYQGKKLVPNEPVEIHSGDSLKLASTTLEFEFEID